MASVVYVLAFGLQGMWDSQLPDQGSNPHPLHWKAKSHPLDHQGIPSVCLLGYSPLKDFQWVPLSTQYRPSSLAGHSRSFHPLISYPVFLRALHSSPQPHRNTSCPLCTWPSPRICSYHRLSLALSKSFGDLGHGGCRVGTFTAGQMRVLTCFWCLPRLDFPFQLGPASQSKGKRSFLKCF